MAIPSFNDWQKGGNEGVPQNTPPVTSAAKTTGLVPFKQWSGGYTPNVPFKSAAIENFPGTMQTLADLQIDPLSFKADPHKAINDAANTFKNSWHAEKDAFESYKAASSKDIGFFGKLGATLHLAGTTAGLAFSPISAFFAAAEDVPVLGSAAKLVTLPFSAAGEGGADLGKGIVEHLPIPEGDKEKFKEGVGDIFALAAQFALGKLGEVGGKKLSELTKKYGEKDANTIIKKAKEVANNNLTEEQKVTKATEKLKDDSNEIKKVYNGSNKVVNEIDFKPGKTLKINEDQQSAIKQLAETGNIEAQKLLQKYGNAKVPYNEADILIKEVYGKKYDTIKYENNQLPIKGTEYHDLKNDKFYSENPDLAKLYAQQSRGAKYTNEGLPTKASLDINKTLVEKGFNELPEKELAKYSPITKQQQIETISKLLETDIEMAKKMAMGHETIPSEIKSQPLFNAVVNYAVEKNDINLMRDLAKSPLAEERSVLAQELGAAGFNKVINSPVEQIRDIQKSREAKVARQSGTKDIKKAKEKLVEKIKKEKPIKKVTKQSLQDFIKSIEC